MKKKICTTAAAISLISGTMLPTINSNKVYAADSADLGIGFFKNTVLQNYNYIQEIISLHNKLEKDGINIQGKYLDVAGDPYAENLKEMVDSSFAGYDREKIENLILKYSNYGLYFDENGSPITFSDSGEFFKKVGLDYRKGVNQYVQKSQELINKYYNEKVIKEDVKDELINKVTLKVLGLATLSEMSAFYDEMVNFKESYEKFNEKKSNALGDILKLIGSIQGKKNSSDTIKKLQSHAYNIFNLKLPSESKDIDTILSRAKELVKEFNSKKSMPWMELTPAIETRQETKEEKVGYVTIIRENPNLPKGEEKVITPGVYGIEMIVEEVKTQGGKEISRKVISSKITKEPVNKIIEIGTKEIETIPGLELTPAIETHQETKEESVPFETKEETNPNLPKGEKRVKIKGKNGVRTIVEEVKTQGGKEISRKVISSKVTQAPVNKIIEIGTKEIETIPGLELTPAVETRQETREESVPFEIKEETNPNLPKGEKRVKIKGKNGVRTIVEEVKTQGGKEISRKVISNRVTTDTIDEVIEVGTKESIVPQPKVESGKGKAIILEAKPELEIKKETITFKIKKIENSSLEKGVQRIKMKGKNGTKEIAEEVIYKDGKEVSRKVISETLTSAKDEIIEIGTKESTDSSKPKGENVENSKLRKNKKDKILPKTSVATGEKTTNSSKEIGFFGTLLLIMASLIKKIK